MIFAWTKPLLCETVTQWQKNKERVLKNIQSLWSAHCNIFLLLRLEACLLPLLKKWDENFQIKKSSLFKNSMYIRIIS
jgi:hypothetical protein